MMNESVIQGFLIFGILQAVFFSLLFWTKKNRTLSDKIIGIWLLVLAVNISMVTFFKEDKALSVFSIFQMIFTVLHGPFLYLYSSKLTLKRSIWKNRDSLHFLPFIILLLISLFIYIAEIETHLNTIIKITGLTGATSGLIYSSVTVLRLIEHKKNLIDHFSNTKKINLNWLLQLSIGILIIWIGAAFIAFLQRFLNYDLPIYNLFIIVPVFIFYIGFYGIKQKVIFPVDVSEKVFETYISNKEKDPTYEKSGLTKDRMKKYLEMLIQKTENEKLYLNSELNLSYFATVTKIPAHHITQTLNEYAKLSFYDFVNRYRVEEFKIQVFLPGNKNFSLLGIAFDCGFNSKSSFNRIFKKHTNMSPSEYKNSQINKL